MRRNRLSVFPATPAYVIYTYGGGGAYTNSEEKVAPDFCSATISTNDNTNFPTRSESRTRFHTFPFITIIIAVLLLMFVPTAWGDVAINATNFPDPVLREWLQTLPWFDGWKQIPIIYNGKVTGYSWEWSEAYKDGVLSEYELNHKDFLGPSNSDLANLSGIQYLTNLKRVYLTNVKVTDANINGFSKLTEFYLSGPNLARLNASGCSSLKVLGFGDSPNIKYVNVNGCSALETIYCTNTPPTIEGLTSCRNLRYFYGGNNNLTSISFSGLSKLEYICCDGVELSEVNVNGCTSLKELWTGSKEGKLHNLDLSSCSNLDRLGCLESGLRELDLSYNTKLTELHCENNCLTELDLSNNKALTFAGCSPQTREGLRVKAVPGGYEVCLKDYVQDVTRIDISTVGANDYKMGFISYDGENGTVIFPESPRTLHYKYRTYSPNDDLMYVTIKSSMNVDVIERGGPTDNIIWGISENSYLDVTDNPIREDSIAGYSAKQYGKKGFVADGNSRLIVRVQTQRPGSVTFSVKENIGVEVESLRNRAKLTASTPVQTSSIGRDGYQASAVLVAPEEYPSWGSHKFPSENFTVNVKFTADNTDEEIPEEERQLEENITLEIHAAPVLLIHSLGGNNSAIGTFYDGRTETFNQYSRGRGVFNALVNAGFGIHLYGSNSYYSMFNEVASVLEEYNRNGITCTKIDLVGYGMGGLAARCFCVPDKPMDDGNYYTIRSYRQGMVRRIITIGTPHQGSPWADYMMGDNSILNDRLFKDVALFEFIGQQVYKRLLKYFLEVLWSGEPSSDWVNMTSSSPYVMTPFPSNVPMHAIYGDVSGVLDGIIAILDGFGTALSFESIPRIAEGFTHFNAGKITTLEGLKAFWSSPSKDAVEFTVSSVGTVTDYAGITDSHPIITSIMQVAQVILDPKSILFELAKSPFILINESMFHGEEHDMFVSASSAKGDIGYSTKAEGWQYRNSAIYKQDEIGEDVASLLKGDKSRFGVLRRNNTAQYVAAPNTAILRSSPDEDTETIEDYFVQKLTLTAAPATLSIRSTGRLTLSAVSDVQLEDDVYVLLKKDGNEKLFIIASKDKSNFEAEIEFSSRDTGIIDAYCFTRGDGTNIYTSNTVRIIIKPDTEISGLAFANDSGVIFMEAGSEVNTDLTATAQDGSMFDVSSPAMGTVWTSSNPAVAYVNDNGLIHAQADGTATLTAEYAGLTASIIVNVGNELYAPQILTTELDNGTTGRDYTSQLQASGTPLIYWRLIDGDLPDGFELSSSGTISGNTNQSGTFSFTVEASNIAGSDSREISITVNAESLNESNFPDPAFWNFVVNTYDYNHDGTISQAEISGVTGFDVSGLGISSLKGIEYFTALEYLTCDNNNITELDLSANANLLGVSCNNNQIRTIDLSSNKKLKGFWCMESGLTSLNVNGCTALEQLGVQKNSLQYLDVTGCPALTGLHCQDNQLLALEIGSKPNLTHLYVYNNQLPALDVTGCPALTEMDIGMNNITFIDLNNCSKLVKLYSYSGKLAVLDITNCPALQELNVDGNNLAFLDLSNSAELVSLNCWGNNFTALDISGCPKLDSANFMHNDTVIIIRKRPEFRTHTLLLSGQIGVNFYMYLPENQGLDYSKSYVEFDINGDKSNPPQYFDPTFKNKKGTYYGFRCYIKSIQMADKITATFHYGGNQTITHEYSAKQYIETALANSTSAAERALTAAIRDYGHFAQVYLARTHNFTLGKDYALMESSNDYTDAEIAEVRQAVDGCAIVRNIGTDSGIERVGFSLSLDADTVINLYLYSAAGYAGSVSAKLPGSSGNDAVYQSPNNRYKVEIGNVSAHKLADTYTVRVKAKKEFDVKVSAFSYVYAVLNNANAQADEKKAVVSLYKYYVTTMDYRAATGQ